MDTAADWVTTRHVLDVATQWYSKQLANSILLILLYYMKDCMYLVYFNAPVIWTYPTPPQSLPLPLDTQLYKPKSYVESAVTAFLKSSHQTLKSMVPF